MNIELRKKELGKQGYRLVGNHSAIKICTYCRKSLNNEDVCYKKTFYDINSWQCIQAAVTLDICNLKCEWCWRDIDYASEKGNMFNDKPKEIINGFIEEQREILQGFYGSSKVDKNRVDEAMKPKHVALSLTGDACLYPKLPELVDEIRRRGMTSFVVTNGTFPYMVKKLINKKPTQLYITLPAPNKEVFEKSCKPLTKNGWEKIIESLNMLGSFERGTIRMTLAKDMNMFNEKEYANLLKDIDFRFLELKAAMPIGYAQYRMRYEQMPSHDEIKRFSEKIAKINNYYLVDEKRNSRVVLLMKEKESFDERKIIH